MDDSFRKPIEPVIVGWFSNTLLPVFSWFVSGLISRLTDYKIELVLLHPTITYKQRIADTWVKNNDIFSCAEILSLQTSSGRRRGRKRLRKILRTLLRETKRSKEFLVLKCRFQQMLDRTFSDSAVAKIPAKTRIEIDIGKLEGKQHELFTGWSQDEILEAFPKGSTLADRNLKKRVASEVDGYSETMRGLLWEVSQDWSLLMKIQGTISEKSKFWKMLGFDPNDEPRLEALIDSFLDLTMGQENEDKLIFLTRWFMDRILVSQYILHPYSGKRFGSYIGIEQAEGEENLPLSDEDRLSQFCDLAGIEMSTLTAVDSSRILDILHALDAGYDFASKRGVSMQTYYGDRADSEKTQRQRLFKKLRDTRDIVK